MATRSIEIREDGVYVNGEKADDKATTETLRRLQEEQRVWGETQDFPKDHRPLLDIVGGIFRRSNV